MCDATRRAAVIGKRHHMPQLYISQQQFRILTPPHHQHQQPLQYHRCQQDYKQSLRDLHCHQHLRLLPLVIIATVTVSSYSTITTCTACTFIACTC
jgi:hypothetical protein